MQGFQSPIPASSEGFPPLISNFLTLTGYPTIWHKSDPIYLKTGSAPTGWNFSPTKLTPTSGANHKSWLLPVVLIVQFSCSGISDSLRPHGLQNARLPYPSPTPGACSNSCPSSQWWHPTISSSVVPFSSCLQTFPASGSFPMGQFFTSGGQSIGVLASALVFSDYTGLISFRLDWLDLLAIQGTLKSLLQHHSSKAPIFQCLAFFMVQLSYPYMTTGKTIALTRQTFVGKVSAF